MWASVCACPLLVSSCTSILPLLLLHSLDMVLSWMYDLHLYVYAGKLRQSDNKEDGSSKCCQKAMRAKAQSSPPKFPPLPITGKTYGLYRLRSHTAFRLPLFCLLSSTQQLMWKRREIIPNPPHKTAMATKLPVGPDLCYFSKFNDRD